MYSINNLIHRRLPATDTNTHHTAHEHTCKQILAQVIHVSGVMHTDTDRPPVHYCFLTCVCTDPHVDMRTREVGSSSKCAGYLE